MSTYRRVEVDQEQAEPAEPLGRRGVGRHVVGAREQQAHLRLERLRRPDLAPADDEPAVAVVDGAGGDPAGVGAGVGFGHAERDVQVAGRGARQERVAQAVVAEPHHRVEPEHRDVDRRRRVHPAARRSDPVEHQRRLGDAAPATAPSLGDRDPDPAALGERGVELPREPVLLVARRPVRSRRSRAATRSIGIDDRLMIGIGREVHRPIMTALVTRWRCRSRSAAASRGTPRRTAAPRRARSPTGACPRSSPPAAARGCVRRWSA